MRKQDDTTEAAAEWLPIESLTPWADNPRSNDHAVPEVAKSIKRFGFASPIIARPIEGGGLEIIAGHTRHKAAISLGLDRVPVRVMDLDPADAKLLALADNRLGELADWTGGLEDILRELDADGVDLDGLGWSEEELDALTGGGSEPVDTGAPGSLAATFGAPPVTLLDSRQGYWQDRKRAWVAVGIQSEIGRGSGLAYEQTSSDSCGGSTTQRRAADLRSNVTGAPRVPAWAEQSMVNMAPGTSIFDPVLAELMLRWFSPPGATVLDPFAGGSVRGIVTAMLGRHYTGIDLRAEQVEANRVQADDVLGTTPDQSEPPTYPMPRWLEGDSTDVLRDTDQMEPAYDFILSCPPYGDLEVYCDDPLDLSNMQHADFIDAYRDIIGAAVGLLKEDSFAAWVVGDFRDKKGLYRNFVSDTIAAFEDAGARLYNEAILVTPMGTLPLRVGRQFQAGRKMGKTHQNVLVFVKGDPRIAADRCGTVDLRLEADGEPE